MDFKKIYETNADARLYVDKYCKTYRLTVEEALKHLLVQSVLKMYYDNEIARGGVPYVRENP